MPEPPPAYTFSPIGYVRSPFVDRASAPRQPGQLSAAGGATIELLPGRGFEDALSDLTGWEYIWVIFVFHKNVEDARGWRPKVLPPRSTEKRGVFATRSPHRPNPIGMSVVRLESVDGLVVRVADTDILDGTPVLDLKPYVAYADAIPDAHAGWLAPVDPAPRWEVVFSTAARVELAWLAERGVDLEAPIAQKLALGPQPHAYRRIRAHGDGLRLALKEWRVDFAVRGAQIDVRAVRSGYRPKQLATDAPELHRDFAARFGA